MAQALSALTASPGARAFYDAQRAKGLSHHDALRRLANRLVGILHGCLKTRTLYDEDTAWGHRTRPAKPLDNLSPGMSFMRLERHERGIHVVWRECRAGIGSHGSAREALRHHRHHRHRRPT